MIIYFLFLFLMILFFSLDFLKIPKGEKKYFAFILFFLLFLLASLRYETGTDWDPYYEFFINNKVSFGYAFEIGYVLLNNAVAYFFNSYTFMLLIITLFIFFVNFYIIKNTEYIFSSIIFFYANTFILFLGGNRQMIAFCFGVITLHFLTKKKYKQALLFLFFGFFFHKSILLILPLFFFSHKQYSKKIIFITLLTCIFLDYSGLLSYIINLTLSFALNLIGLGGYSYYIIGNSWLIGDDSLIKDILLSSEKFFFISIILLNYEKVKNKVMNFNFHINVLFYYYILFFLFLNTIRTISGRGTLYFRISEFFLISALPFIYNKKENKTIISFFLILYLILRFMYVYLVNPFYTPYHFFFEE